jgi:hypothetical protein
MEFTTADQYLEAKHKYDAYESASKEYRTANKTNGIPFEVYSKFPYHSEVTNEMRSAIETFEFLTDPPKKYTVYVNEKTGEITTWTGQKLGTFRVINGYRSNFRDYRISLQVKAINGYSYYGTYFKSAGDYAHITMNKTQQK